MTTTTTVRTITPLRTPFGIVRQPTAEECNLVGRSTAYSEPFEVVHDNYAAVGDYVIETPSWIDFEEKSKLVEVCEAWGICDAAHVIPAGSTSKSEGSSIVTSGRALCGTPRQRSSVPVPLYSPVV